MIISNSTPLIAFARIGNLALLKDIVGKPVIPAAVEREITEYGCGKTGSVDLAKEAWISVRSVKSEHSVRLLLSTLDRGEAEVIVLALEHPGCLVLIDELAGRQVAESIGLSITGSVGILIHAKESGKIKNVRPYLDEMIRRGIHYSRRFVDEVLKRVGEL